MASNDYFSIVYKLLAILYENLKSGARTDLKAILNDSDTFPIDAMYWAAIFEDMLEKGYIKGAQVVGVAGGGKKIVQLQGGVRITADGVEYLDNNSSMKKAKEIWGVVKDFLPVASMLL